MSSTIRIVLCDVGGVLVQLGGVQTFQQLLRQEIDDAQIWPRWLHSPAVRAFETGRIDEHAFARALVQEFDLTIEAHDLLAAFHGWPVGLFPGTADLIRRIPPRYSRALLSNSNALHWPRIIGEMGLGELFEHQFVSYLTGKIKPDVDAFEHVVSELACSAHEIFFADDNEVNVAAARAIGMHAVRVCGPLELERALTDARILDPV